MQNRSNTIIAAGVAVAVIGALMVFLYARSLRGTAGATGTTASAWVATTQIASGTKAEAISTSVKQTGVPVAARPADAITAVSQLSGQAALRTINPGEVISASEFGAAGTPSTSTGGLAIPAGHNAITITTPVPNGVAGYVSPGDQVNIFVTNHDSQAARLLLSNVTVLSTVQANQGVVKAAAGSTTAGASTSNAPATGDFFFTLSLTPQDAEKIVFAQTYETLYFGLIHPGDGPATTPGQTLPTLFK